MDQPFALSADARTTAGVLLLTIVAVEYGGWFLLRVVRGRQPATPFQQAFFRAGHAHAGVLVILALVGQLFADAAHLSGVGAVLARNGIWAAAVLIPAGFFLSAAGRGVTAPNRLIVLLYAGMAALAVGVIALGVGLLTAQRRQRREAGWRGAYIEDVGFTLITLFAGFVIIGARDLDTPAWLVFAIDVLGVLAGRAAISRAMLRAA